MGTNCTPPAPAPRRELQEPRELFSPLLLNGFGLVLGFFIFLLTSANGRSAGKPGGLQALPPPTQCWSLSQMGGELVSFFFFLFFQRDFIKRKMNLNPGACSRGTTGPGPAGGRTPSPFQPRGCCSPEKTQRQGSRGRAPPWLPPQHVAIYRREGRHHAGPTGAGRGGNLLCTRGRGGDLAGAPGTRPSTLPPAVGGATLEIVSAGGVPSLFSGR